MSVAIKTENLTKIYKKFKAVDAINIEVRKGDICGFVGPNGAGKTTTIGMLTGLVEPSAGRCFVNDLEVTAYPIEVKRKIGYLPDGFGFYAHMDAVRNMKYFARLYGLEGKEAETKIASLIEQVGLKQVDKPTGAYSRGMRQRLGLARAFINQSRRSSSWTSRRSAWTRKAWCSSGASSKSRLRAGKTIFFSSHVLSEVQHICNTVCIISRGKIVAQGNLDEVKTKLRGGKEFKIFVKVIGTMPRLTNPLITDAVYDDGTAVIKSQSDIRDEIAFEPGAEPHAPPGTPHGRGIAGRRVPRDRLQGGLTWGRELIVAEKEFRDHVRSKRFLVIMTLLMVLAFYGISQGLDAYNMQLTWYKQTHDLSNPQAQQTVKNLQQMIQDARDRGALPRPSRGCSTGSTNNMSQPMPSVLPVFRTIIWLYIIIGMILGAALGFDQISRERDEGSLKFLVSSPIYRDAIINGKTIGAIATLALAMAVAFAITVAIVMLKGITPGAEDFLRVAVFFVAVLLYCTVFFAITMLLSTLSRNTTMAALSTVGVIFAIAAFSLLSTFFASQIAVAVVGPAPAPVYSYVPEMLNVSDNGSVHNPAYVNNNPYDQYYKTGLDTDHANSRSADARIADQRLRRRPGRRHRRRGQRNSIGKQL